MMGIFDIISLLLNLLFGAGFAVTFATLKSVKKEASAKADKAAAEAKTNEIDNAGSVVKLWRELAENTAERHAEVMEQVDKLRAEVNRLRLINNKIVRLLDRITPENMTQMVQKIKEEIDADDKLHDSDNSITTIGM